VCVRVSAQDLKSFRNAPAALPEAVEPVLTLAEEVVLLSLDAPRGRVGDAVALAGSVNPEGPQDYRSAVRALQQHGLLVRAGVRGKLSATSAAKLAERRARVLAVIRRAAAPTGGDADLLVLLAACRAESLDREDYLRARIRIGSIKPGDGTSRVVEGMRAKLGADSMSDLADVLLPVGPDLRDANFDPGVSAGVYMAGGPPG